MSKENVNLKKDEFDVSKHEFYQKDPDRSKRFKNFIWNSIWSLPFENYEKYYTNGKIFKMTQNEKIEMTVKDSIEKQKYTMFIRIVKLRPNILNNDDMELFEIESNKCRRKTYIVLGILFLNGSFFTYKMALRKDIGLIWKFLGGNLAIGFLYSVIKLRENRVFTYLFNKYENYINFNEMRQALIEVEKKRE
jgi:hypothetical protein